MRIAAGPRAAPAMTTAPSEGLARIAYLIMAHEELGAVADLVSRLYDRDNFYCICVNGRVLANGFGELAGLGPLPNVHVVAIPPAAWGVILENLLTCIEVCLRCCVICRETRDEAIAAAQALRPAEEIERQERAILKGSDSKTLHDALAAADDVGWMNRNLYAGLVPFYGSSCITLIGSPDELAEQFLAYRDIGVTQFIIAGWPKLDEMVRFGRDVLPRVRRREIEVVSS